MDIHTRIRERREALNLDRYQLAALCGVAWQTVQAWERPADHPKSFCPNRKALPLVAQHLKVDVSYLLTGISATVPGDKFSLIRRYVPPLRRNSEGKVIDFCDVHAYGDPADTFPYRTDWLRKMGLVAHQCVVAELEDHAMKINGQLLIDTMQNTLSTDTNRHHALYLVLTDHGCLARRIHVSDSGMLILQADHADPEVVHQDSITVVGRVVAMTNFMGA